MENMTPSQLIEQASRRNDANEALEESLASVEK
jgi:hypothetical protein